MTIAEFPNAYDALKSAIDAGRLRSGTWGDGNETVCMMSAINRGAKCVADCVTANWPEWLVETNVYLFDAEVGAKDESKARQEFALDVAMAVSVPVNMDLARDLFLIRRLDTGDHSALKTLRSIGGDWSAQISAGETVVALLNRRISGEDVAKEMVRARAAAYAASASAADRAASAAAYAAARAASAAADAAARAASASASDAARAAAYAAAYAAARAASAAAAARADLMWSLNEAQITGAIQ